MSVTMAATCFAAGVYRVQICSCDQADFLLKTEIWKYGCHPRRVVLPSCFPPSPEAIQVSSCLVEVSDTLRNEAEIYFQ